MRIHILSIFPEFFASPLQTGLLGRAIGRNLLKIQIHNPRDEVHTRHKHLDDAPYGGGPGMIMQAEPIARALENIKDTGRLLLMSPAGKPLSPSLARDLAHEKILTLICGRYEGIDARLGEMFNLEEIAFGEAVLNGGETAALAVIESVARFVPGFLGHGESVDQESFTDNLLEYPQYTRPANWRGLPVPETLLQGNHKAITVWRRRKALEMTALKRPGMLADANIASLDIPALASAMMPKTGRNLCFCLMHYPVRLENGKIGASSLTNLDVHDISRISHSYGMGPFFVVTPIDDQRRMLQRIISHWLASPDKDRAIALKQATPARDLQEAAAMAEAYYGMRPMLVATSASWPEGKNMPPLLTPGKLAEICAKRPALLLLGTARGLAPGLFKECDAALRPLRFLGDNHLSVRSAAAIMADRLLGDFK